MDYQQLAVEKVVASLNSESKLTRPLLDEMLPSEFYVVWFCKTLQNWKALVSTDSLHGFYWEVTHNGDKDETYVDRYVKEKNTVVSN